MGDTGKSSGEPGSAPDLGASLARWRRRGQREAAQSGAEPTDCPAVADLYHAHYRSMLRLAALLTGDAHTAEAVVVDSFVALDRARKSLRSRDDALPYLRRLVVARSRPAARHRRPASGDDSPVVARMPGRPTRRKLPTFKNSAVVRALGALPSAQREAIVLTRYLDLTDEQAAAAMRVSQAALRRHVAAGKAALQDVLARESTPPPRRQDPGDHGPEPPKAP